MGLNFLNSTKEPYDIATINYCIRELGYHFPELIGGVKCITVDTIDFKGKVNIIMYQSERYTLLSFLKVILVPKYAFAYIDNMTTSSFNRLEIKTRTACLAIEAINEAVMLNLCPYRVLETLIKTRLTRPLIKDINSVFERKTLNEA